MGLREYLKTGLTNPDKVQKKEDALTIIIDRSVDLNSPENEELRTKIIEIEKQRKEYMEPYEKNALFRLNHYLHYVAWRNIEFLKAFVRGGPEHCYKNDE